MTNSSVLPIHNRLNVAFTKGKAAHIFDENGKKYLDFGSGIAVNSLGHCHPDLIKALNKQSKKLWHVSNAYKINELEELATLLCKNTFADYAFFCNSGAEAIECVVKMIRKYFYHQQKEKYEIITFKGSFHGRTITAISASNYAPYLEGFGPKLPGFKSAIFNNIDSVKKLINKKTAGILIEPIQGEGGIIPANKSFLEDLRQVADENDLLLAFDEVQCGAGRTGKLYAYQHYCVKPDIIASAKGIGGGFPVGACLATKKAASGMVFGTHGTTYGGNPLAMKVAQKVIEIILKPNFLENIQKISNLLFLDLRQLQNSYPKIIKDIRGVGLMIGIELNKEYSNKDFVEDLAKNGLLVIAASNNVLRLIPPLIIDKKDIKKALNILEMSLKKY